MFTSSSSLCLLSRPRALRQSPHHTQRRWIIHHSKLQSFDALGLKPQVLASLRAAFPNVQRPTVAQEQFIPAILEQKDVLIKDSTGAGKSFGLLLALLSLPRRFLKVDKIASYSRTPAISALILMPHRDLAFQFMHWVQCLHATHELGKVPLASIAQVMVRGSSTPIEEQARAIARIPPHIVIGTPQALLEALQLSEPVLPMQQLATVVVDEADYMLESRPRATSRDKYVFKKYLRMLMKHPTPARQILDAIYRVGRPTQWHQAKPQKELESVGTIEPYLELKTGIVKTHLPRIRPQLVFTSATLKAAFRHGLLADGKWLTRHEGDLVKVITNERQEDRANHILGGTRITHSALVYSVNDGSITNIKNAVEAPADPTLPTKPVVIEAEENDGETLISSSAADQETLAELQPARAEESTPSPFPEPAMEAIATVFALEVPRVGLLVLHPSASVERAVDDMRKLGINAHGLDVVQRERGGSYLLRKGTAPEDDPTLLVATLATVRGLDMPDLTHVFILGGSGALDQDSYIHAAGRVGRFGKGGKVITVVPRQYVIKGKVVDEPNRLMMLYKALSITPVRVEHFGQAEESTKADEPEA